MEAETVRNLSLEHIVSGCAGEAQRERRQEQGFCFELFRRALASGSAQADDAWQAIQQQYGRLIGRWVAETAYARADLAGEQIDELAHDALVRCWRSLTAPGRDLAADFKHIGDVLKYVQQCAITTVLDHQRRAQRQQRLEPRVQAALEPEAQEDGPLQHAIRSERQAAVRRWVDQHVTDPREQIVLRLSFETGWAPLEIAGRYPTLFDNAQAVSRIKERLLKRMARALQHLAD